MCVCMCLCVCVCVCVNVHVCTDTHTHTHRGVAAINKVRGQICPCAVGNTFSARAIGLIVYVNMHALMKSGGALPPVQ